MCRKIHFRFIFTFLLIVLIGACAKISSPAGGPRDKTPPVVVKCVPQNGATNFKGKKVSITFNEYVALDNVNEKFMASPPMKKRPKIYISGKSVNVEFEDILKDSTTYTFYFQDAIRDVNEGNVCPDYQFVFSTGPFVDSLSVTGNIYKAFNLEIPEKALVMMYRNLEDSAVSKQLPDYISSTDPSGYFRINNIRPAEYRLYALVDEDNSKNYNLRTEEFAFLDSTIIVKAETNFLPVIKDTSTVKKNLLKTVDLPALIGQYKMYLFKAPLKDYYITGSKREFPYQMIYTLSLPPDTMSFDFFMPEVSEDKYKIERTKERDTMIVWITDSTVYSQQLLSTIIRHPFTDTLGIPLYKTDTIQMRFVVPRTTRVTKIKITPLKLDYNIRTGTIKPGQQIVIKAQTPFRLADTSLIRLYELADTGKIKIPYNIYIDSARSTRYFINSNLIPGNKYLFIADSSSFANIYYENIDSTGIKFSVGKEDSYCRLTLNLENSSGERIVQLLKSSETLIRQIIAKSEDKVVFSLLETGVYRVRTIFDMNNDGKWTTGDFSKHRQPEPVSYYPVEIELKLGWQEVNQDWNLRMQNVKDRKLRVQSKKK